MDLYFESAGMILALITMGKYFESRSKGRTSEAISKLLGLAPKTATVLRDGAEVTIAVEKVAVGDTVVGRPGERIPVDGVLLEGGSAVDESALTVKHPGGHESGRCGDRGHHQKTGYFTFGPRRGDDTTLGRLAAVRGGESIQRPNANWRPGKRRVCTGGGWRLRCGGGHLLLLVQVGICPHHAIAVWSSPALRAGLPLPCHHGRPRKGARCILIKSAAAPKQRTHCKPSCLIKPAPSPRASRG